MASESDNDPQPPNARKAREHRARILRKLNCLIAVLQVAIGKVRRSLENPAADVPRLGRIHANLENTLNICKKAKASLERSADLPADLPSDISSFVGLPRKPADPKNSETVKPTQHLGYRHYVEFTSLDEYKRFRRLPPISRQEVEGADVNDLCRKLQGFD